MTTTDPSTNSSAAPVSEETAATAGPDAGGTPGVVGGRPLVWLRVEGLAVAGAVGLVHLGLDRLLAYGLKYDHNPVATHLGIHGRHRPAGARPDRGVAGPEGGCAAPMIPAAFHGSGRWGRLGA